MVKIPVSAPELMFLMKKLSDANKSRKALQLAMITTYGVKQNEHSGLVQSQVRMGDLFVAPE